VRNLTKALTMISLLAPVSGYSLGIGDIRVRSALNQRLNAEIALVATRGESVSNIKVNLAPSEKFDAAGVSWSYFLSKIRFKPVIKPNGSMVIKVTSTEALKEPYLNFLVEVSWSKGNLYREFTVLVDPPAEYQEPAYQEAPQYDTYVAPEQNYVPRRRASAPAVRRTARQRRAPVNNYGGQIVTRRNDTLWRVAERARGGGVSVEQMMMALYQKNPHAFFQPNVNALSAGKTLKIPEKGEIQQLSRREALAEFSQHNAAWKNGGSVTAQDTQVAKEEVVDSQLKLEAPAEGAVAGNESVSPSTEEKTTAKPLPVQSTAQATPESSAQTSAETGANPAVDQALQSKVAALEKQLAMMQELIVLKDKQLAEMQSPNAKPPTAIETPVTQEQPSSKPEDVKPETLQPVVPEQTPTVTAPQTPQPVTQQPVVPLEKPKPPVKKPVTEPQPVPEETSSTWLWLVGGLATLLGFGWLWYRRQKILQETDAESMFRNYTTMRSQNTTELVSGAQAAAVGEESSFLNDFKSSDFEAFESFNVDHGDIDPLAEADVYLAYGRYQQAEDLIRQAIKDQPDRDDCKLKLLEIYHANSSQEEFEKYAQELVDAGKRKDRDFWAKVAVFAQDICPDSALFKNASTAAIFDTESDEDDGENVLFNSAVDVPKKETSGAANFEMPEDEDLENFMDQESSDKQGNGADKQNLVSDTAESDISFDLESTFDEKLAETSSDNDVLEFDLDFKPESQASLTELQASDFDSFDNKTESNENDNGDLETYEFDFNPETITKDKEAQADIAIQDTWEPEQTIDFSIDKLDSDTGSLNDGSLDFEFDVDTSIQGSDRRSAQGGNFPVSDLTDMDEMETKLDLAKAYIDMGDTDSAKDIITQVLEKGSAEQKSAAQSLLDDLG
jgi:pilus assembly protein FimV